MQGLAQNNNTLRARNLRIGALALLGALAMLGLGFAAVPLYRMFCQATGFGGTTQRATARQFPALATALGYTPASTNPFDRVTDLDSELRAKNQTGGASVRVKAKLGAREITGDNKICKVSAVGVGMRSHPGVASQMFKALADEGINIQMISTSEIKISVVLDEKYLELAVRVLHRTFGLDQ